MREKRKNEIKAEATKRLELWLSNSSFDEMTVYGSLMRFHMALGLLGGYPFEKEDWMSEDDFSGFVTVYEFDSVEYDEIIEDLFNKCIDENI